MCSDHIIYLTSSGNQDLFPTNNPGRFVNRLSSPIILDNNINYEIGLISILYPDQYYAILANDDEYALTLFTEQSGVETHALKVEIGQNVLAGDIGKIVKIVNNNLISYMKAHYHTFYHHLFAKNEKILKWNETLRRVEINRKDGVTTKPLIKHIEEIYITMNPRLAAILGFPHNRMHTIYSKNQSSGSHMSALPPSPRCGVDYIYMYTDIIQPSNFGGQLVNILDCFTLQNGGNKGIHNSVYKSLNTSFIDQISVDIRDQKGRPIHFIDDSTLTCVLHIRPK